MHTDSLRRSRRAAAPAVPAPRLSVVHWGYSDGTTVCGCPLEHDRAQAIADAYRQMYPQRRVWLESPPAMQRPGAG